MDHHSSRATPVHRISDRSDIVNHNSVKAVAALFQPPLFSGGRDPVADYAMLGTTLAHEIIHGFDSQGRLFDERGRGLGWLSRVRLGGAFKQRCRILIDQYAGYQALPGVFVDGRATLMENLADLGGLLIAFDALAALLGTEGLRAEQDGYTAEQRFFITFAQHWRERISAGAQTRQARGPHAPTRFRALGPLRNCDAFHTAFDLCPADSMYLPPAKRARLW